MVRIDLDQQFTRIDWMVAVAVVAILAMLVSIAWPTTDKIVNYRVREVTLYCTL